MSEHEDAVEDAGFSEEDPRRATDFWVEALGGGRVGASLVQKRAIREAISTGRYRKLHKLLRAERKGARSREEQQVLDAALGNARLFLEPLRSPPGMATWWGFGTRLVGRQAADPRDGSYVSTYFLSALYLPLWPLQQYLVRDAEEGGWHVLGQVPLSPKVRTWRMLSAVAAVLLVIGIVGLGWHRGTHDDVHVLNALPVPVTVRIGPESVDVGPDGRVTVSVPSGSQEVLVTTADGTEVERTSVRVDGSHDFCVYNVCGAAPLYLEEHGYGDVKPGARLGGGQTYEFLGGERWVSRLKVEYPFREPAKQATTSRGEKGVTHLRAALLGGGLMTTCTQLGAAERMDEAVSLATLVSDLAPEHVPSARMLYSVMTSNSGLEAGDAFVARWRERAPALVDAHRLYQDHWEQRGQVERVRKEYREAADAAPDDPDKAYLYCRIAPFAEAQPILDAIVPKHPEHRWLRLSAGWIAYHRAHYAQALPHYEFLAAQESDEQGYHVAVLVRCLAALARWDDARARMRAFLEGVDARRERTGDGWGGVGWLEPYGLYATARWRLPEGSSEPTVLKLLRPQLTDDVNEKSVGASIAGFARDPRQLARFRRGLAEDDEGVVRAELLLASKERPDTVHQDAAKASTEMLQGLDAVALVAIIDSCLRAEASLDLEPLFASLQAQSDGHLSRADFEALPALGGLDEELDPELRAAMLLAASHRVEDPKARAGLRAEALRFDPLGRVVP